MRLSRGGELYRNFNGLIRQNLGMWGTVTVLTVAGSTFVYYGGRTGWRLVERKLMRPKLIIASSKKTLLQRIKERLLAKYHPSVPPVMICEKGLENRLENIVRATRNIYAKNECRCHKCEISQSHALGALREPVKRCLQSYLRFSRGLNGHT